MGTARRDMNERRLLGTALYILTRGRGEGLLEGVFFSSFLEIMRRDGGKWGWNGWKMGEMFGGMGIFVYFCGE